MIHLPFVAEVSPQPKLPARCTVASISTLAGSEPRDTIVNDNVTISRKTNAFAKSDEDTCNRVLATDLIYLQSEAKQAGANAVVGIVSNYNDVSLSDSRSYKCHKGFLMSGVARKAKLAKIP